MPDGRVQAEPLGGAGLRPSPGVDADASETDSKLCNPVPGLPSSPGSAGLQEEAGPPAAGRCAEREATPEAKPQGEKPERQRRAPQGRDRVVHVRVTPEEEETIRRRAAAAGVTAPQLLVELAVLGEAGASERRAHNRLLLDLRRQVVGMATNLNQLARWANTRERLPPGLSPSLAAAERTLQALTAAVEEPG